ncbi:1292_t:CDS:10 [Paraglomus occultum]|uniref:1292_t:CDS:1 n=1 Tax=Paraglomus occultum TaxID=144539 RepID=A0A9N9EYN0_9GLOM|nr:1292_t:CDS:10 [Paraglomus occultum]
MLRTDTSTQHTNAHTSASAMASTFPRNTTGLPTASPMSSASTPLSPQQLSSLKYQIVAYRLISKNMSVPPHLQQAMFGPGAVMSNLSAQEAAAATLPAKLVEGAYTHHSQSTGAGSTGTVSVASDQSAQQHSSLSPPLYNAYIDPYTYLKKPFSQSAGSRFQRLLIPSITPPGLDPIDLLMEKEREMEARREQRIRQLENKLASLSNDALRMGNGSEKENNSASIASPKIKALIEVKSLKLLPKRNKLRQEFIKGNTKAATLATSNNRADFRRMKKPSLRDARKTEKLERQQRVDRERREKQKHLDYLQSICAHGRDLIQWHRTNQAKQSKIGRAVLNYHSQIEKEEQKKEAQKAKDRLKALRNDDEEAYLKLIDQVKDTRITHLLKQTDAYLGSLAQAVLAQQNVDLHNDPTMKGGVELMDEQDNTDVEIDGKKLDYFAVAHRIKEEVEQPALLEGGTLKEYQVKGLQWMVSLYNNRLNGILADEMGLGKTIQTISLVTYLVERKKQNGPFLIVVPLSTLTNWTMEFEKWAPQISKCVYKGPPNVRKELQHTFIKHINFQVLLTTYEYIIKDKPVLSRIRWVYMIIDEGHRMKNVNSKLSTILTNSYQSRYRLILTGTPLQNNLPELWSLLNFVLPRIFDSVKSFDEWFNTPFANTGGQDKIALNEEEALLIIRRLHKVLRPFLLRRLKKDVESELPEKVEKVLKCRFSALQNRLYSQMKKHGMLFVSTGEKGKTGIKGLNNTIMQLRKICNHPFVFEDVEKDINPSKTSNSLLYRVSGKFELLDRVLPKFYRTRHRVLIFFQMTAIMNIMEDFLHYRRYKYLRLDGSTKAEDRSTLLRLFNAEDSDYFVFLLSTRAGGLGLNLQSADTVIIFDSDWNPHQDLQAQDRAHRIGQTREVRILRLISQKSIEENILARAQYKLDIDGKVIQAGKFDQKSTAEEREAFLRTLLEGDNDETNDVDDDEILDDEDLNLIISRNDEELALFKQIDQERKREEEAEWRRRGGRGKCPERLIQDEELPEMYRKDEDILFSQSQDSMEYGRGQRARGEIRYDDGLTEEQWLNAIEDEEVDVAEVIAKKQEAKRRREAKKRLKAEKANHNDMHPMEDKKRKIKSDVVDTVPENVRKQMTQIFTQCYDLVTNCMDESEGEPRQRAYLFIELPSKKVYPQYYVMIAKPIALDIIKKKIKNRSYRNMKQFKEDFHLMFENAKTFNEEGSQVYMDACELMRVFDEKFEELCPNGELPSLEDDDEVQETTN